MCAVCGLVLGTPADDPGPEGPGLPVRDVDTADLLYAALSLGGLFPRDRKFPLDPP